MVSKSREIGDPSFTLRNSIVSCSNITISPSSIKRTWRVMGRIEGKSEDTQVNASDLPATKPEPF